MEEEQEGGGGGDREHVGVEHELVEGEDEEDKGEEDKERLSREEIARRVRVENLGPLLSQLQGHLERGNLNQELHPSGVPRSWSSAKSLSSMEDSDVVDSVLWVADPTPELPRIRKRVKQGACGRVAILRDTSMSMQGMWNQWASLLSTSIMDLAKNQKMNVGYLEFNSKAQKFVIDSSSSSSSSSSSRFFTSEYQLLEKRMHQVKVEGLTNYEAPLSIALDEFAAALPRGRRGGGGKGSHGSGSGSSGSKSSGIGRRRKTTDQHILFITDGQPTSGDRHVRKELSKARDMGVSIHTIFIGYRSCPPVLDELSNATNGTRWASFFCPQQKTIKIIDRESDAFDFHGKDVELRMVDRMTRMPTVFQRYLDENNVVV